MAFSPFNIVGQVLSPVAVSTSSVSLLFPVAYVSPLVVSQFQIEMCLGLRYSFRTGAFASLAALKPASTSMLSEIQQPSVIGSYLQIKIAHGRIAGCSQQICFCTFI